MFAVDLIFQSAAGASDDQNAKLVRKALRDEFGPKTKIGKASPSVSTQGMMRITAEIPRLTDLPKVMGTLQNNASIATMYAKPAGRLVRATIEPCSS